MSVKSSKKSPLKINQEEQFSSRLIQNMPDGVTVSDASGRHTQVNPALCKMTGFSEEELVGNKAPHPYWPKEIHATILKSFRNLRTGPAKEIETVFIRKNGERFPVLIHASVSKNDKGEITDFVAIVKDITVQKLSQARIEKLNEELEKKVIQRTKRLNAALLAKKESVKLYRSMFVNNHAVMLLIDPDDSSIVDANPAACKFYGYTHEEICSLKITDINTSSKALLASMMKDILSEEVRRFETKHKLSNGEIREVEIYSGPIVIEKNILFSIVHDITERIKAQEEIKKNIKTQEVLLKEVNHRVKNNLAALIGILHIEQDRLKKSGNDSYINLLTDLTSRIQGLLTVHQLFSLRNWQPIEISQLCERIIKSAFSGMSMTMKLDLNINPSDILVSSRIAHHLTLVINELATNSLKHALGNRKTVRINVKVTHRSNKIRLMYKDDGTGFPKEFVKGDFRHANIGFELIRGIVVQSLEGTLSLQNKGGAIALITFENQTD